MRYSFLVLFALCAIALGGEEVTNGLFDADSDWTKGTGWAIAGGVAIYTDNDGVFDLSQTITGLTDGQLYRITYTCTAIAVGQYTVLFDGTTLATDDNAATHTYYARAIGTSADIIIRSDMDLNAASFDVVSVIAAVNDGMSAYVGGSASDLLHAVWSYLSASDSTGANGESVLEATSVDVDSGDAGKVFITSGADVANDMTGGFINIHTNAGTEATGRYEILAHDQAPSGADTFLINLDWIDADTTDMQYVIGGAIPIVDGTFELQDVLDDSLSSAAANNVKIYATATGTLTATIDWDTGGGTATTRKSLIGVNSSYVDDGTQVTITTTSDIVGLFDIDVIDYLVLKNIIFDGGGKDASRAEYGLMAGAAGDGQYTLIENCQFTKCETDGMFMRTTNLMVINCEFDLNGRDGRGYVSGSGNNVFDSCSFHDNDRDGFRGRNPGGSYDGNVFYDNGKDGTGWGFFDSTTTDVSIFTNNTFFNNPSGGISVHTASTQFTFINNTSVGNTGYGYVFNSPSADTLTAFMYNHASANSTAHTNAVANSAFAAFKQGNNVNGSQAAADIFVNVNDGSEDLTPKAGSDLIDAGLGADGTGPATIGAKEPVAAAGGGIFPQRIERRGD